MMVHPRCGKSLGRGKLCARPFKHRGVCSLRSLDLEQASTAVLRAVRWEQHPVNRSESEFCSLATDIGFARALELLKRARAAGDTIGGNDVDR